MLKKLKLYLDTSAIGYLDEQTSPRDMRAMFALWNDIIISKYDVVISELTLMELHDNKNNEKLNKLLGFITQIEYETIGITAEAEHIA
ncbi:MAG: hypothetical protein LBB91_10105, partial [Clostridiales bacterium]|nr:hypothetical protein [Clostridiales bacterium]